MLKKGGVLFSAALTPYSVLLDKLTVYSPDGGSYLENPDFLAMVERELRDGTHINPNKEVYAGLGSSHLHTAKALKAELKVGGFSDSVVHGPILLYTEQWAALGLHTILTSYGKMKSQKTL